MSDYFRDYLGGVPSPRPQATAPSWLKETPSREDRDIDRDYVIKTVGGRSERILDLTHKPMQSRQSLLPESDRDKKKRTLEGEKRRLSGGYRGGLDKEGVASAMKDVKRKLDELQRRGNPQLR
ncbi:MAG: hypothetical protein WC753_01285 [Candidatus Gracilibacteria bacterium]